MYVCKFIINRHVLLLFYNILRSIIYALGHDFIFQSLYLNRIELLWTYVDLVI